MFFVGWINSFYYGKTREKLVKNSMNTSHSHYNLINLLRFLRLTYMYGPLSRVSLKRNDSSHILIGRTLCLNVILVWVFLFFFLCNTHTHSHFYAQLDTYSAIKLKCLLSTGTVWISIHFHFIICFRHSFTSRCVLRNVAMTDKDRDTYRTEMR